MKITVKLFAQYREGRFKIEEREYDEGITVQFIMDELGITEERLPLGVLMVNSRHQDPTFILKEGDILALFPKVGGG